MPLTDKMRRFCEEYVATLNAKDAAKAAGYAAGGAADQGWKLLKRADIVEEVVRLQKAQRERLEISSDAVVVELARIAFSDVTDVIKFAPCPDGEVRSLNDALAGARIELKDASENLPKNVTAAIAEVSMGPHGLKVKMHPKEGAIDKLGRHLGVFTDKKPDDPRSLHDVEEIKRRLQQKLKGRIE